MRIVIAGAGEVGFNIAKELSEEYEVTVIELDEEKAKEVDKLNVNAITGNSANVSILKKANVENADLFLAVTGNDEINLLSALAAKKLGAKTVIVRVDKPEYASRPIVRDHPMGYDVLICPKLVLASYLARLVTIPGSVEFAELEDVILVELAVREDSPMAGKRISEVGFPKDVVVATIHRNGEIIIPRGDTVIEKGDILAVFGKKEEIQTVRELLGEPIVRNVFIVGAGEIGVYTAKILEKSNLNIKLIEVSKDNAENAMKELRRTKVIVGNATDLELLEEEEVGKADVVICATESDEKNLLIALLAKSLGAKKAFVKVEKKEYIPLFEKVGIDVAVSPRKATYLEVIRILRLMDIKSVGEVKEGIVVLEFVSGIDGKKISEIKLPRNTVIVAVKKQSALEIAKGDTVINKGDILYVVTDWDNVDNVKKRLMP